MEQDRPISPETQVVLLLCGNLGQKNAAGIKPLSSSEYYQFARWIREEGMDLAEALDPSCIEKLSHLRHPKLDNSRLSELLERGGQLALAVEYWTGRGIWVISRYDEDYPTRLSNRLGKSAPLLLFGIGDRKRLDCGGLAIVGSRDVDEQGIEFTRKAASICAAESIQLISGGARGVDSEAMTAALERGGSVVGVVADSLVRAAVSGKYREAIIGGNLLLVSPLRPRRRLQCRKRYGAK